MPQPPQYRSGSDESRLARRDDGAIGVAPAEGAPADVVVRFDAENLLRGIVFHVVDEGLAREVSADSVQRALTRLRRLDRRPAIRRSAWLAMTNHDRLEWLLAESRIIPLIRDDDTALLSHRET